MQRSFDDLGTPLSEVTFVVLDLETTGGSPSGCAITEVGALKFKGGECLGTFQTLVNPGVRLPREIVFLTGITEAMVAPAPIIESVLPAFAEFIGDAVIVGHNVRFDLGFLRENLKRLGYRPLTNRFVDTCALARRLVRDEVPNCKLATLARHFRTSADPCHRALDDARATAEVFHQLLERAGTLGVLALDDLLALPKTASHPQVAKLRWVAALPRKPGVYLFRDGVGRVLYVGRATDLRRRVRSYFSSDDRRKIGPLLREAAALDHVVCSNGLEAAVMEVRLIHQHLPRFNRQVKVWSKYRYIKISLNERFPRLSVARSARSGDRCIYVGPVPSTGMAKLAIEAIESVIPLRRCTARLSRTGAGPLRPGACTAAQLGVSTCPCAGAIDDASYGRLVAQVVTAVTEDPRVVLDPLEERMHRLADSHRFEGAEGARERASTFARLVSRHHRMEALVLAGRLEVELHGGGGAIIDRGRLVTTWTSCEPLPAVPLERPSATLPIATSDIDEISCVAAWLDARAGSLRIRHVEVGLAHPSRRLPRYEPRERGRIVDVEAVA